MQKFELEEREKTMELTAISGTEYNFLAKSLSLDTD